MQDQGQVPKMIQPCRTSRQVDKTDGSLKQFIESQPQIFVVAFLCEIERQQKQRQHNQQNGIDQAGQALKEAMCRPQFQRPVQVFPVPQMQCPVGEEVGICTISHGNVDTPHHQGKGRFIGGGHSGRKCARSAGNDRRCPRADHRAGSTCRWQTHRRRWSPR